jgi:hypothetical protein
VFGVAVKAQSPFAQIFVAQLANGWHGYVPTCEAFAPGGYEARFAYHSRLLPEAGDPMRDAALRLLRVLARGGILPEPHTAPMIGQTAEKAASDPDREEVLR